MNTRYIWDVFQLALIRTVLYVKLK